MLDPPPPPALVRKGIPHDDARVRAGLTGGAILKLGGVRATDAGPHTAAPSAARPRPRIACTPGQAAIIILILIAALCASLTLLIRQSANLARLEGAGVSSETPVPPPSSPSSVPDRQQREAASPQTRERSDPGGTASATPPASTPAEPEDGRIDINTADAAQLQTMNGVGPVTAQRIIDYRNEHGPYASVDDLLNVKGIGAKTLEKIRTQAVAR